jgi:hypothetical protein
MNNDPMQETNWLSMGEQWREALPMPAMSNEDSEDILTEVRRTAKRLLALTISAGVGAAAITALLTTIAIDHFGVITWTFAVIGWSLSLPLIAFLAYYHKDFVADTLPTSSMIEALVRKRQGTKTLLEFLYVLLSVETMIASSFWLVTEWRASPLHYWTGFAAILISGTVLAVLFRWQYRRAETRLEDIAVLDRALKYED